MNKIIGRVPFSAILIFVGITSMHAQAALTAAGGNAVGDDGSVTYTIGQVFYRSIADAGGSVSPSVQQPVLSFTVSTDDINDRDLSASIYPNPGKTIVTLSIQKANLENVSYQLFDVNGKLLRNQKVNYFQEEISLEHLSNGIYLLKVVDRNVAHKTFKIIKNQ